MKSLGVSETILMRRLDQQPVVAFTFKYRPLGTGAPSSDFLVNSNAIDRCLTSIWNSANSGR